MSAIVLWPICFQLPLQLGVFIYGLFISYYIVVVWTESGVMLTFILAHLLLILWTLEVIKVTPASRHLPVCAHIHMSALLTLPSSSC